MKKLEKIKELVIVVDVINGFITEGNMKDEYISHIIPGIRELVSKYVNDEYREVFYIRDCHTKESLEFKKFPLHCLENTRESEVVDELKEYEDEVRTYKKNSTSAIFAPHLLEDISKMRNLKRVTIVGCCSDICVINLALPLINYFDQNNRDIEVEINENLIETYDAPNHKREEYNMLAKKLLIQAGAKFVNGEVKKNGRK